MNCIYRILGAGEWGIAVGYHLAMNGHNVELYGRNSKTFCQLIESKKYPKLGINLDCMSDISTLEQNLFETYQFRSLTDERVYKDENSERLLGNYRACVLHLADRYHQEERTDEISGLFKWAEENIYMGWEGYYTAADFLSQIDQHVDAGYHLMKAGELLAREYEVEPVASYENILAISGALLNPPYTQPEKALNLIETLIGLQPNRPEAYYELAASLQALGNTDSALMRLQQYRAMFGNNDTLIEAETILQQSINSSKNNATTSETGQ